MCLAFGKVSNYDCLYGYNLDVDPNVWDFSIYKNAHYFALGLKIGSTTYFSHGVNNKGVFANLPYMNGEEFLMPKGVKRQRIDLLVNNLIRDKISFNELDDIIKTKTIININKLSLHSLLGDGKGNMYIVEPGYGIKQVNSQAIISNFPVLTKLDDYSNPFYGKDRYDIGLDYLNKCKDNFSVKNGLELLEKTIQTGKWATRISFVYSRNENAVYYAYNGDFSNIEIHRFNIV